MPQLHFLIGSDECELTFAFVLPQVSWCEFMEMNKERLYVLSFIIAFLVMHEPAEGSKKVIIHLPYRIKNVKHTHTIYKVIPHHHHEKKDEYVEESEEFDHYKK